MFDLFTEPLRILFDTSKKISSRILYSTLIILLLILLNDCTGFIENYMITSKLNHIKTLKELGVKNQQFDKEIEELAERILNRKNYFQKFILLFESTEGKDEFGEIGRPNGVIDKVDRVDTKDEKSLINWRNFTASFTFLIFMLMGIVLMFVTGGDLNFIGILILVEIALLLISWGMITLLGLIPEFDNINYNYAINITVNGVILLGYIVFVQLTKYKKQ